jgi:hypothetical protein
MERHGCQCTAVSVRVHAMHSSGEGIDKLPSPAKGVQYIRPQGEYALHGNDMSVRQKPGACSEKLRLFYPTIEDQAPDTKRQHLVLTLSRIKTRQKREREINKGLRCKTETIAERKEEQDRTCESKSDRLEPRSPHPLCMRMEIGTGLAPHDKIQIIQA